MMKLFTKQNLKGIHKGYVRTPVFLFCEYVPSTCSNETEVSYYSYIVCVSVQYNSYFKQEITLKKCVLHCEFYITILFRTRNPSSSRAGENKPDCIRAAFSTSPSLNACSDARIAATCDMVRSDLADVEPDKA